MQNIIFIGLFFVFGCENNLIQENRFEYVELWNNFPEGYSYSIGNKKFESQCTLIKYLQKNKVNKIRLNANTKFPSDEIEKEIINSFLKENIEIIELKTLRNYIDFGTPQ